MTTGSGQRVRIREATFDDYDDVRAVAQRSGLGIGADPVAADPGAAKAAFVARWTEFPDRDRFHDVPIGWVLEDGEGRCVGTLTNYYGTYRFRGETWTAAIAGGLAVDPEFRGPPALMLVARHLRQRGVDLSITTTASREAGAVLAALKAQRVPHPACDETLFWTTNDRVFARAALGQMRLPAWPPVVGAAAAVLGVRNAVALPRSFGHRAADIESCPDFDPRFDRFWDELVRRRPERLLAVRTSAMLAWHFRPHLDARRIAILAEPSGTGLLGYAVVTFDDDPRAATARAHLVDLQVLEDDAARVRRLVGAAYAVARERGVPMLQVIGFDAFKRTTLLALGPFRRTLPSWLYYYQAMRPELAAALASPAAWDPSPYDGDATL